MRVNKINYKYLKFKLFLRKVSKLNVLGSLKFIARFEF